MTRIHINIPLKVYVEGLPRVGPTRIPGVNSPIFLGSRAVMPSTYLSLEPSIRASVRTQATKTIITPTSTDPGLRASMRAEALRPGSSGRKFTDKTTVSVTDPGERAKVPEENTRPIVATKTYMEAQQKAVVSAEVRARLR